ncbi:hypothetical protein M422DRAFT_274853 [Sphaerobolus stellatus SS14]|uniref:Uncharacterized protein n=1 Tax=Sphaerobolus stellatus (strain SS14) TaxID=990650 RepID=A0A0C9U5P1_SPHS4|nr:hypothetical protein M422DRAFT_274853 [Sphaerobolus stellatus SS14]
MTTNKTWPDATNYQTLTLNMANAAKPRMTIAFTNAVPYDEDTDSYVLPFSTPTPFTVPDLYATMDLTGPTVEQQRELNPRPKEGEWSKGASGQVAQAPRFLGVYLDIWI